MPDVQLAPSAAVACLTPALAERGEPEYPFAPWKRGEGGRVLVEMIFTGAALAPEVQVIESTGDKELITSVRDHVKHFRLPCLQDRQIPLRLRQDYVFLPDQRKTVWTLPTDMADATQRRQLECMATLDGSKQPAYPRLWGAADATRGNVLATLRFTAADQPPELTTYTSSRATERFTQSVRVWARQLRVPCLETPPIDAQINFRFRMEGDPEAGFRQIDLMSFMRRVKDLDRHKVRFDTRVMACPFDVRLEFRQPHLPNRVGQVAETTDTAVVAARQPLLAWLSTLDLDLTSSERDVAFGDTATITIPCATIDL